MVTQSQSVAEVATQMAAQSQQEAQVATQVAQAPTQMVSQTQVAKANRNRRLTSTLVKQLETTDDEFDFINSPSWQSVLSSNQESTSTAA